MNVEQLIRQYLYENKSISLPGMGKLAFSGSGPIPSLSDKNENEPLPDLTFTYNLQEQAEPAFIAFVAEQTGKIKPLATSDIDSFFTLAKQFVNIGKAFIIDGVGVINKMDNGQYSFAPGTYMPVVETVSHLRKPLKIREPVPVIKRDMNLRDEPEPLNKKLVAAIVIVILLALLGWGAYYFLVGKKGTDTESTVQPAQDSIGIVPSASVMHKNDAAAVTNMPPTIKTVVNPNDYKAVFETTNDKKRAIERLTKLRSYKFDVRLDTNADSTNLKLWVPVTAASADMVRVRDSVAKVFARPVTMEKI